MSKGGKESGHNMQTDEDFISWARGKLEKLGGNDEN